MQASVTTDKKVFLPTYHSILIQEVNVWRYIDSEEVKRERERERGGEREKEVGEREGEIRSACWLLLPCASVPEW